MSRNQLDSDVEAGNRSESVNSTLSIEGRPIILENGVATRKINGNLQSTSTIKNYKEVQKGRKVEN